MKRANRRLYLRIGALFLASSFAWIWYVATLPPWLGGPQFQNLVLPTLERAHVIAWPHGDELIESPKWGILFPKDVDGVPQGIFF